MIDRPRKAAKGEGRPNSLPCYKRYLSFHRYSYSQSSTRQLLLQCTQAAVLFTQRSDIACPYLVLTEFLIQGTHLQQICAGCLVVLTFSHGNQSFGVLPVQFDCLTWTRLLGGPGNLEGDIAISVISIATIVDVSVAVLLSDSLQQLQSFVNFIFVQGNLDQECSVPALLQVSNHLRSKSFPATSPPGEIA